MSNTSIFLSLGSNLEDRRINLERALETLQEKGIRVLRKSSIYETEPVEVANQPDYLNLVCEVDSTLDPEVLLCVCEEIESELGRMHKRTKEARHIDIDILFHGKNIVDLPQLKIPHPELYRRNFVLIPLEEIASEYRDPVTGKTIRQLRQESSDRSKANVYEQS